ncbi:MAG: hypothetical protein IJ666_03190 [Ruminococcus sp.]|nr:hypothetical protein [Ruminococcus sp.]
MQMWNEIETEEDIDFFMKVSGSMHDSVLVSAEYSMGCGSVKNGMIIKNQSCKYVLRMIFDSEWTKRIEMIFTGVRHFNMCGFRDIYSNEIYGCYLKFHTNLMGKTRDDRLIVWSDGYFSPEVYGTSIDLKNCDSSFIIADSLKWRFIKKEAEKCSQKE